MSRHIYPEWRDENARRFFPFDRTDPRTLDGRALPQGLIVDATVHPANTQGGLHLSAITLDSVRTVFEISDSGGRVVATGARAPVDPRASVVELFDEMGRCAGVLVVDPTQVTSMTEDWPHGTHMIATESATFVLACCELVIDTDLADSTQGVPIDRGGELYLVAEGGMRFQGTEDPQVVKLHAAGEPLFRRDNCDFAFESPRFVQEVVFQKDGENVVATPDEYGNITFSSVNSAGVPALSIQTRAGVINVGYSS